MPMSWARVAASEDRTVAEGVAHAQALLQAGLGRTAGEVALEEPPLARLEARIMRL